MRKTKSKNIASIIIFLGILLTLSLMGYKILSNGIHSQSLSIGQIHIDGLYLRLNNKLILEIQSLDVSALQNKGQDDEADSISADEILTWIKRCLFVISYFEKLDIQNIVFSDNLKRSVHYDGREYEISAPEFVAKFGVEDNHKNTQLLIHELEILRFGLQIQGQFVYQNVKKTLEMDISLSPKEPTNDKEQPTLYIKGITDFYRIEMEASSTHLYNLDTIKPYVLKLNNKMLNNWLFKNVQYDVMKVHSLRFQSTLDRNFFAKLQQSLALDLAIESPKVYFAPHLKPIEATRVIVYMREENLSFLFKEPSFTDTKLEGSEVQISNVFTQPMGIKIAIRSNNATLSDELADILRFYDINIPVRSVDSKLRLKVDVDMQQDKNKQMSILANGNISAPTLSLSIAGLRLDMSDVNVILSQKPSKSYVQLLNTKIDYAKNIQGILNAIWNLEDSSLQGDLLIEHFALSSQALSQNAGMPAVPEGSDELTKRIIEAIYADSQKGFSEEILKINPNELKKIHFKGHLSQDDKVISLPDFGLNVYIGEQSVFELSDIAKIYPYSPILRYFGIPNGYMRLSTKDFKKFGLSGEVSNLTYPLYDKESNQLARFVLEGLIDERGIFIGSQNRKFLFVKEGNVIKLMLNGYDLNIDELLNSQIPALAQINEESKTSQALSPQERQAQEAFIKAKQQYERQHKLSPHITYLEARNMDFYLNDYIIPTDMASVSMRDGLIRADATYGNGVANVDVAYSRANVRLNNFSDVFLNRVWKRDIVSGGLFNFRGIYDEGVLKGEISMQNTTYKDLAIVQNILALIDTIPALLTFRKPGLGANGYEIKQGKVDFVLNDEYLVLENIDLVGSSIDVEGGGLIRLQSKEIDVILKASTLKTLADIIDKIPLVGYVILGSDGKFTTGIALKGTLDNPKSEVNTAEDILLSPFEMVGRILKPVDTLLSGLSNALNESVESSPLKKPEPYFEPALSEELDAINAIESTNVTESANTTESNPTQSAPAPAPDSITSQSQEMPASQTPQGIQENLESSPSAQSPAQEPDSINEPNLPQVEAP
ncbi:DUF3971 domain-containing protein [Helicobacter jaachi]|nr:DUF3971 domain-containing protein [Helicobacter jaachi]